MANPIESVQFAAASASRFIRSIVYRSTWPFSGLDLSSGVGGDHHGMRFQERSLGFHFESDLTRLWKTWVLVIGFYELPVRPWSKDVKGRAGEEAESRWRSFPS
jgi:hypothetical protein